MSGRKQTFFRLVISASLLWGFPAWSDDSTDSTSSTTRSEKVILQLRWDHQFQFAGYYAALWQGYYADAGFDVDIRSAFEPGGKYHKVTKEVAAGRADFGTAGADILSARDKGAPLVIVSSVSLGETIEINFVDGEDLWLCKADAGQLENTILNLGINARDAMPNGGKLTISTENVDMNDDYAAAADVLPGEYVLIAVSDTGTGMSRDVLEHAFEPFYTTKEVGQGSGLGLSMVYGFAKQSGGHATIYSEENIGTTIKLYLPKSLNFAEDKPSGQQASAPRSQGETILVVEDDPEVRTLTVDLLRGLGYDIIEAADAASAIRALENSPRVNLLFSDVVLPGGRSGIDLAKQVRTLRPGISALFTSGYTEEAMAGHGALEDDFELLGKPFKRDALAQKIRSVLDQNKPR